jgi:hypothetical protein
MHNQYGRLVPAVEIDTPYGQIYVYKNKDKFTYELPSGRARHGAEKFLDESAEEIKALVDIIQNYL